MKKNMNISPTITWEILKLARAYNKTSRKCLLCLHEKLAIITYPSQNTLLNKSNQKFYSNVDTRTNIISYTLTLTHNPSNTSTSIKKKKQKKTNMTLHHTWRSVSTIFLHQVSHRSQRMYHLPPLIPISFFTRSYNLLTLCFHER